MMANGDSSSHIDHSKHLYPRTYDLPQFFGIVESQVYRSETLQPIHYSYIQTLKLTTILVLSPEKPSHALKSFTEENNIKLVASLGFLSDEKVHLGLQGWKPDHAWSAMAEGLIQDSLRVVLNQKTHPILVTSTSGIHEVGILFGILRKLQHWSFSSIIFEYRSFAGPNARFNEEQFIELFDEKTIVLPKNLPVWWLEQQELWEEEQEERRHVDS